MTLTLLKLKVTERLTGHFLHLQILRTTLPSGSSVANANGPKIDSSAHRKNESPSYTQIFINKDQLSYNIYYTSTLTTTTTIAMQHMLQYIIV